MDKPRVRFCWHCSLKLWGIQYTRLWVDGAERILHKSCAILIQLGEYPEYDYKSERGT